MKSPKRVLTHFVVAGLVGSVALLALPAAGTAHRGSGGSGKKCERVQTALDGQLTAEEQATLDAACSTYQAAVDGLKADTKEIRDAARELRAPIRDQLKSVCGPAREDDATDAQIEACQQARDDARPTLRQIRRDLRAALKPFRKTRREARKALRDVVRPLLEKYDVAIGRRGRDGDRRGGKRRFGRF